MRQDLLIVAYFVAMGAIIIAVDVLFLRDHFWARLGTNVGIVAVCAIVYLVFVRDKLR